MKRPLSGPLIRAGIALLALVASDAAVAGTPWKIVLDLQVETRDTATGRDTTFTPVATEMSFTFDPAWDHTEFNGNLTEVFFAARNRFTSPMASTMPWLPPPGLVPERNLAAYSSYLDPQFGFMYWDDRYRLDDPALQHDYAWGLSLDTNVAGNGGYQPDIQNFKTAALLSYLAGLQAAHTPIGYAEVSWIYNYGVHAYEQYVNYGGTARIKSIIPPDGITPPPPVEPSAMPPKPLAMLVMSRDQRYFAKAYNDYSDIDGDNQPDTTYTDVIRYYGYFHCERCYVYDDAGKMFVVAGVATGPNTHFCEGGLDNAWSGNFLNWATMTRMDVVRKALYGGYRSTDTLTTTVLERAHLPTDAHAFAKYYNGADLDKLTPYAVGAVQSASTPLVVDATSTSGNTVGRDDAKEGITICNATPDSSTAASSQSTAKPPLLRAVAGNYQLWAMNERWQCTWNDEHGVNANGNNATYSGIYAAASDPGTTQALKTPGANRDHVVRVKVCEATYFDATRNLEACAAYGVNRKPEGALQRYGLNNQLAFGLMTGSFQKNISGGVLRKNAGLLTNEVDPVTGVFLNLPAPGIISTLDTLRVWGYGYLNGTYLSGDSNGGENCAWQLTDIKTPNGPGEGKCASWGNPYSEIYLEAIRYFATMPRAPTTAFNGNDLGYFPTLRNDTWAVDPLHADNACASLNIVALNAGVDSYDDDQTNLDTRFNPVPTTNAVGDGEGITGRSLLVGRTAANTNELCTAKTITALGSSFGICPEAPTIRGSYHVAGLAHYAHTHDLRADLAGKQVVTTYGLPMATNRAEIRVPLGGNSAAVTDFVRILPAYRFLKVPGDPTKDGGGTLVDFRIVRPHTEVASMTDTTPGASAGRYWYAKFLIVWDDSEQGGDFDQDMWGTLEYHYDLTTHQLQITTTAVAQSTAGGQLFGFITEGTTKDGFHAYSGIQGANYADPIGVTGCANCRALNEAGGQRGAQSYTFTISYPAVASTLLKNPLYYAAKWGGFMDENGSTTPDAQAEWDALDIGGNPAAGGDGSPDTFFDLANPGMLAPALDSAFAHIRDTASKAWLTCAGPDTDGDGIPDIYDNCKAVKNANQRDTNSDGYGNACDGDLDNNGVVNATDLAMFKRRFGTRDVDADFNGDGVVNAVDLAMFKKMFGKAAGPSGYMP